MTLDQLMTQLTGGEKAFDKVDQEKLIQAMDRVGAPDKGKSSYRKQRAGIRQGCPLSPYLFICLMFIMFHDIHEASREKLVGRSLVNFNWWEIVYADDTMLVGHRAR